jgi:hypothetical protein
LVLEGIFQRIYTKIKGQTIGEDPIAEMVKFILSIIGQTISVEKLRSNTRSFYYISDLDARWVIMPSWIEYIDTDKLVLTDSCIAPLILDDGTVIVLGK